MGDTYYKAGDWSVICDYSGFKCKRSECRRTWDGNIVRKDFWEARQPQDFVRGKIDNFAVTPGEVRDVSEWVFLEDGEVTAEDL